MTVSYTHLPLTLIGNVLVGSGYTDVTDINENVYNYVITKDLEYINIKAETVNSTSKVSIASEYNLSLIHIS